MDEFQVPADLGRIPGKIYSGEGFTNFTADQWKNFFLIYATVVLWDHLSAIDRKILTYFVRVCTILVRRIVDVNEMEEAHIELRILTCDPGTRPKLTRKFGSGQTVAPTRPDPKFLQKFYLDEYRSDRNEFTIIGFVS